MKMVAVFLCALMMAVLGTTTDVQAQTTYTLCNNSPVTITATIVTACAVQPNVTLRPGRCFTWTSSCAIAGVVVNGTTYLVGYSGPMAPPNPPTFIAVAAGSAIVL